MLFRSCAEAHEPTKRELDIFSKRGISIDTVWKGRGCSSCNMTGYRGRLAIHEVLAVDNELRKAIMNEEPVTVLREIAVRNKTIFLIDDGLLKIKQGLTTTEEVLRVAITE